MEEPKQDKCTPIGVFWDIENCSVPKWRSALWVVQKIRTEFSQGHREVEFMCVCDASKESKVVIQELNSAQVCTDLLQEQSHFLLTIVMRNIFLYMCYTPPCFFVLTSSIQAVSIYNMYNGSTVAQWYSA